MTAWPELRHFAPEEFRFPGALNRPFLRWLDEVRDRAGVPFVITSDVRTEIPPGGSRTSLHLVGRAVDFRWTGQTPEERARIVEAVVATPTPEGEGGYELGIEPGSPGGPHWHLGLFPAGRANRMFAR